MTPNYLMPGYLATWPRSSPRFVPIDRPDGSEFLLNAVLPTPDRVLGIVGGAPADPSKQTLVNPALAILDLADNKMQVIMQLVQSRCQGGFAADDKFVVWVEADDPPGCLSWHLYSRPLDASQPAKELARARTPSGQSPTLDQYHPMPDIDHGTVVWAASDSSNRQVSDVYMARAEGSAVQVLAVDAAAPQISGPFVGYIQHSGAPVPGGETHLAIYNLTTSHASAVGGVSSPSYWAVGGPGPTVAWVDSARKKFNLLDVRSGQQIIIANVAPSLTNYIQFVSVNDHFVAWSQEGGEWIYDISTGKSVQLNQHPLFDSVQLRWDSLAWLVPIPSTDPTWKPWHGLRGYYVVDTRTLQ